MRYVTGAITGIVLATALFGCSGGGASLSVRVSPYELTPGAETTLAVPQACPFSITERVSDHRAELSGAADSDAVADPAGSAMLSAEAANGGEASASFKLGHAVRNAGDRQAEATLTLSFDYDYVGEVSPDEGLPSTTIDLELVMRNRRTRGADHVKLVCYTSEQGGGLEKASKLYTRKLMLSPGDIVDVYLSGQMHVVTGQDRAAKGRLNLSNASLSFNAAWAPAVQTGND